MTLQLLPKGIWPCVRNGVNVSKNPKTSEKLAYLFKKINWGASFLDATAIEYMNDLSREIKEMEDGKRNPV
jgi:hypothetical protein